MYLILSILFLISSIDCCCLPQHSNERSESNKRSKRLHEPQPNDNKNKWVRVVMYVDDRRVFAVPVRMDDQEKPGKKMLCPFYGGPKD